MIKHIVITLIAVILTILCIYKLCTAECSYFNYVWFFGIFAVPMAASDSISQIIDYFKNK